MSEAQRRLAAIVAIDVAGYSRLLGRDEQGDSVGQKFTAAKFRQARFFNTLSHEQT